TALLTIQVVDDESYNMLFFQHLRLIIQFIHRFLSSQIDVDR
ncbi:unnamed protein product, partial [Rotaria magnacalcarata]